MSETKNDLNKKIEGLVVYASGTFPVEISNGKRINSTNRVKLNASVDCETGEVSFYVDMSEITKLS